MSIITTFLERQTKERLMRKQQRKQQINEKRAKDSKVCVVVDAFEVPWWCGDSYDEAMEHWSDAIEMGLQPDIIDFENKTSFEYEDFQDVEAFDEKEEVSALLAAFDDLAPDEISDDDFLELLGEWEWLEDEDLMFADAPQTLPPQRTRPTPPNTPAIPTPAVRRPKTKETVFMPVSA